jgi:hypothetical protein
MLKNLILKLLFWRAFIMHKGKLPTKSEMSTPKMEYEVMSGAFIWEDEGLWEINPHLADAFKHVIYHRMTLVVGSKNDVGAMRSKKFDKQIFEMAKKYFPNWIGFDASRCSYNSDVADRIMRIRKVADWKLQRFLNEEDAKKD